MAEDYKLTMTAKEVDDALVKVKSIKSGSTNIDNTVDKVKAITCSATDIVKAVKLIQNIEYGTITVIPRNDKSRSCEFTKQFSKTHTSTPKVFLSLRHMGNAPLDLSVVLSLYSKDTDGFAGRLIAVQTQNDDDHYLAKRTYAIDYLVIG